MIKIIRGILLLFCFFLYGIGSIFIGYFIIPIINIFVKTEKERFEKSLFYVSKAWLLLIIIMKFLNLIEIKVNDLEKLKNLKESIIVATHPSYIDVVILGALIPNTTGFAAEKLLNNIYMQNIVKSAFLISGKEIDELTEDTKKILEYGYNVVVFPSGVRHKRDEFPKIRKGAALIAYKTKKNIIPIKMTTTVDFLQKDEPAYQAGEKTSVYEITVLDAINTEEFLEKYSDEVDFKHHLTNLISDVLYN